jgi:hypothetical protein
MVAELNILSKEQKETILKHMLNVSSDTYYFQSIIAILENNRLMTKSLQDYLDLISI